MANRLDTVLKKYTKIAVKDYSVPKKKVNRMGYWGIKTEYVVPIKIINPGLARSTILKLSKIDPSGNNKYLEWMCKTIIDTKLQHNSVVSFIQLFYSYQSKFKHKDIYKYQTKDEILKEMVEVPLSLSKSEQKKIGSEMLFDCPEYRILHITTYEAAKIYGSNTRWCITSKLSSETWDNYNRGRKFYFVLFKDGRDKICIDIHRRVSETAFLLHNYVQGWLANDHCLEFYNLKSHCGDDAVMVCVNHACKKRKDKEFKEYWRRKLYEFKYLKDEK